MVGRAIGRQRGLATDTVVGFALFSSLPLWTGSTRSLCPDSCDVLVCTGGVLGGKVCRDTPSPPRFCAHALQAILTYLDFFFFFLFPSPAPLSPIAPVRVPVSWTPWVLPSLLCITYECAYPTIPELSAILLPETRRVPIPPAEKAEALPMASCYHCVLTPSSQRLLPLLWSLKCCTGLLALRCLPGISKSQRINTLGFAVCVIPIAVLFF